MITIVGAGALGSHVALLLRNMKHGLKVIDMDRVEQKNTQAQFHGKMGLGMNKAKALERSLLGMFGTKIDGIPVKVAETNVDVLLKGSDLVIDCTDNLAARRVIQQFCRTSRLECLHGALAADGTFARVIWSELFVPDSEGTAGEATCVDGEHLPFFVLVASYVALEAQRFLQTAKKWSLQITPAGVTRLA